MTEIEELKVRTQIAGAELSLVERVRWGIAVLSALYLEVSIFNSWTIPVAAELFATSLDVHLVNRDISDAPLDLNTSDNRPATRTAALNRLAHAVCCDRDELFHATSSPCIVPVVLENLSMSRPRRLSALT